RGGRGTRSPRHSCDRYRCAAAETGSAPAGTPSRRGAAGRSSPCRRRRTAPGSGTARRPRAGCRSPRTRASRDGRAAAAGRSCDNLNARELRLGGGRLRHMDAAFLVLAALPPPAARARILAGLHRTRAGRAADGAVALVVQTVVGDPVRAHVLPYVGFAPGGE